MWLALVALTVMLLGTAFLVVFGRRVAALLEDWTREATRAAAPRSTSRKGGPA